jgi:hypothetical protein
MSRKTVFWSLLAIGIGVFLGSFACRLIVAADASTDSPVGAKGNEVKKGDKGNQPDIPKIDWEKDEELEKKSSVSVVPISDTTVKITSVNLKPPSERWSFKPFSGSYGGYVEIVVGDEQNFGILQQDERNIQFWGTASKDSSDLWPVKAEGNLMPPKDRPGTPPHWSARISSAQIEVFIGQSDDINDEANFTVKLVDYPAEGQRPRCPKYMYGKDHPLFIQAKNLPAGQGTLLRQVRVTSESDSSELEITLKETGTNTGVYRNVVGTWSDLLYVGDATQGGPKRVKVTNEEVVTFKLASHGGVGDYDTLAKCDVMIDRAECGSGYFNYVDVPNWPVLNSTTDIHRDFVQMLTKTKDGYTKPAGAPVCWATYAAAGDANCRQEHYASAADAQSADAADLVIWSGHGTDFGSTSGYYCAFLDANKNIVQLHHNDVALGNTDAEWAIFETCRFLNTANEESNGPGHGTATDATIVAELKQMFSGLHLVMGYKTKCRVWGHFAERLINCSSCDQGSEHGLDQGTTIRFSFARSTRHCPMQDQDMVPRVFGAESCLGDKLYSDQGKKLAPVPLSRDPLATDTYVFDEWTVPRE